MDQGFFTSKDFLPMVASASKKGTVVILLATLHRLQMFADND